ncbi:NmrA family NAD(P)-binding protein [Flavitalea flava]
MKNTNILISGAAGLSGSLILQALSDRRQPVRALVRDAAKATFLNHYPGIEIFQGDMLRKESLKTALEGIDRAVLISSANDQMVETQHSFIDACKEAGVRHVIKFSGEESQLGYDPQRFRFTREHEQIEDYLENSGLEWTHVRPSQFMQVYLREAAGILRTGELRLPLEQIRMSPVDLQDVAQVIAALLIEGGHEGESFRITGPEALGMADIAAIISIVVGKSLRYVPVSWEERCEMLKGAGLPSYFIEALAEQAAERCRHPEAIVDIAAHQVFKLSPTTFKQFANQYASRFRQV